MAVADVATENNVARPAALYDIKHQRSELLANFIVQL
jgi:hypothetical protein